MKKVTDMTLLNFLIIRAMKSGTTVLFYINLHLTRFDRARSFKLSKINE